MPEAIRKLRVLVIDDGVDNVEALQLLLDVLGCDSAGVYSGAEGIAAVLDFDPDVAFVDFEMPGMDGCDVARAVRLDHPKGTLRLICLTGRGQPTDRYQCMDAGFDDFFTKPMSPDSVAQVLAVSSAALHVAMPHAGDGSIG